MSSADMVTELAELRRLVTTLLARPAEPVKCQVTVGQVFAAYQDARRNDHSWRHIRNRLLPLVNALGELPAMELTSRAWTEHVGRRRAEPGRRGRSPRLPSETTLSLELGRAKAMFNWASSPDRALIPGNPLAGVKRPRQHHRETTLTEGALARVIEKASPTLRAFIFCCVDAGLRMNEARHLQRDWIRPNGAVTLSRAMTKSRKSRTVVLTPRALAAISEMPAVTQEHPEIFRNPRTGRLYAGSTLWRRFRLACKAAGIDTLAAAGDGQIRIHDLRHTAATAALRRGASIRAVQQMLGHANLATTSGYLHASEADALDLARLMHEGARREAASLEVA